MTIDVVKEAGIVRDLLAKADRLEAEADKKTTQAEDCRWLAAERTEAAISSGATQKAFAQALGMNSTTVSNMVQVWREYGKLYTSRDESTPRYWDAIFMIKDRSLASRAAEQGRRPSTVKQGELKASNALQQPSSAKTIMANPTVREASRRAIIAAEADEAKAYLMARANPVDIAAPAAPGFNWMEADATLSHSRKLINSVSRMVREHGPLTERDLEMVADGAREVRIALEILDAVISTGDLDDALARLLDGEM